jgi:hypothetical protein
MTITYRLKIWPRMKGHLILETIILINFLGLGWKRVKRRDQMIHFYLIIKLKIKDKEIAGELICKDNLILKKRDDYQIFYSMRFLLLDYQGLIEFLFWY